MMESVIEPQRERERERQRELWPRESVIAAGESDGGRCVCVCVSQGALLSPPLARQSKRNEEALSSLHT